MLYDVFCICNAVFLAVLSTSPWHTQTIRLFISYTCTHIIRLTIINCLFSPWLKRTIDSARPLFYLYKWIHYYTLAQELTRQLCCIAYRRYVPLHNLWYCKEHENLKTGWPRNKIPTKLNPTKFSLSQNTKIYTTKFNTRTEFPCKYFVIQNIEIL